MDVENSLEEVLVTKSEWNGSPDAMWQRVEEQIRRRRQRWRLAVSGVAAAAVIMLAGTRVLTPTPLQGGPAEVEFLAPPQFAPPSGRAPSRGYRLYDTLPGFLYYSRNIMVAEVVSEQDHLIPPTEDAWQTYEASKTPPPPDHPKAKLWTAPEPPKPTPAKLFTVKVIEGIKGVETGRTVTLQQLNVTYANAGPEPLLSVGKRYLLFPGAVQNGLYHVGAPYLTLGDASRLHLTAHQLPGFATDSGSQAYLQELDGVDVEQALAKIRYAVKAEGAVDSALAQVGLLGAEDETPKSGYPADMVNFRRFVETRLGCMTMKGATEQIGARYETAVWARTDGGSEVRLIRQWSLGSEQFETTWTFQVSPNGKAEQPVRSGSELATERCR